MDKNTFNDYLQSIGSLIVSDKRYMSDDWSEASVLVTITPEEKSRTGYVYRDDFWEARTPDDRAYFKKCKELWEFMRTPEGTTWHQALIHVTKPGPEINIKFEYDDPQRWSLKEVSLDMQDYAESLRPPKQ